MTKASSEAVKAEERTQMVKGVSQAIEFLKAEGIEPPKTMESLRRRVVLIVRAGAGVITHGELIDLLKADQGTDQGGPRHPDQGTARH